MSLPTPWRIFHDALHDALQADIEEGLGLPDLIVHDRRRRADIVADPGHGKATETEVLQVGAHLIPTKQPLVQYTPTIVLMIAE